MAMSRQEEIKAIQKEYSWFYPFIGGLILLIIGFLLGATWFQGDDNGLGYITNLYTELISIGVTIVVLDRINQWRDRQNLKRRLVAEAGSRSNSIAVGAVDWLRREGWLSLLKDVDLSNANLSGVNFRNANLKGVNLTDTALEGSDFLDASLEDAKLLSANLEGALLWNVVLTGADLRDVNLNNVNLVGANLVNANLFSASLENADLRGANLRLAILNNANLEGAKLQGTTLPDGTTWHERVDMARFTDPNHPNFWQPNK